jgi:hypothetical protein
MRKFSVVMKRMMRIRITLIHDMTIYVLVILI